MRALAVSRLAMVAAVAAVVAGAPGPARAEPDAAGAAPGDSAGTAGDDGYCDYVEGVASAQSAVQLAPDLIGQFGYVEQSPSAVTPTTSNDGLRVIAGVRYSLTRVYEGLATRRRAHADCRRHQALEQVRGETTARALAARAKVFDDAMREADQMLQQTEADQAARRTTAQEATATRLRVDDLRALAAEAHQQLAALPAADERPLAAALAAYQDADADVEREEAKLRRAQAVDLSVRFGLDAFVNAPNPTPYFAVVSLGINVGAFLQGPGNRRAAAGRARLIRSGHDPLQATVDRLRATAEIEARRLEQVGALVADLDRQIQALGRLGGEDSKRYRQTVWFDWVKARAEQAYLTAHLASLKEVLGGGAP